MKVYLISYEINEQLFDYSSLKEAIKMLGDYQHPIESLWFVRTDDDAEIDKIAHSLKEHFHTESDHLFVMQMPNSPVCQGWLPRSFWKWLFPSK